MPLEYAIEQVFAILWQTLYTSLPMVKKNGLKVGRDVVDPDHPQNFVGLIKSDDPQSIIDARPDRTEPLELSVGVAQFDNFDLKISPIFGLIGIVTVTTS